MRIFRKTCTAGSLVFSLISLAAIPASAQACSQHEVNQIDQAIAQIYQASLYGQFDRVMQLSQALDSAVAAMSPGCQQAIRSAGTAGAANFGGYQGYQGYQRYPGYQGYQGYQGGNVIDHGDGGYSTGGVYCGPSGSCYGP